jgi:hypothetical protein
MLVLLARSQRATLSGAPNAATRKTSLAGGPNTTTRSPRTYNGLTPLRAPPPKTTSTPSFLSASTRSPRTPPPRTPSVPSFGTQFKQLLDPTLVAMLDQHSVLQAELENSRDRLVHLSSLQSRTTNAPV